MVKGNKRGPQLLQSTDSRFIVIPQIIVRIVLLVVVCVVLQNEDAILSTSLLFTGDAQSSARTAAVLAGRTSCTNTVPSVRRATQAVDGFVTLIGKSRPKRVLPNLTKLRRKTSTRGAASSYQAHIRSQYLESFVSKECTGTVYRTLGTRPAFRSAFRTPSSESGQRPPASQETGTKRLSSAAAASSFTKKDCW